MRLKWRLSALLGLTLLAAAWGFAKAPAKAKVRKKSYATASAAEPKSNSMANSAKIPPPQAQTPTAKKTGIQAADTEEPAVAPVPASSATLGLFTVETGDVLPKGGWSFSGYANKFTRMPGSISVLQYGVSVGYGITDRFDIYVGFLPDEHFHISDPNPGAHLSLDTPSGVGLPPYVGPSGNPTIYRVLGLGQTPGYIEDFPFAAQNGGGVGPLTLGFKIGLLSERSGAPVSLSLRDDLIIPTVYDFTRRLQNGTQTGEINDQIGVALSKNWKNQLVFTTNFGFRFVKNPTATADSRTVEAMDQADQAILGAGVIAFPEKRIQLMSEYTGTIFAGGTPDNTFGARDPVDGVWGLRLYPLRNMAVDLGYRYMLNLTNAVDRGGFVIKVGGSLWPSRTASRPGAVNHSPVAACSADKTSVFAASNDNVNVTVTASDPDGDPLTYSWSATGGTVEGNGPQVRWLSAGVAPGNYTVTVTVNDGRGGTTTCMVDARVDPRPNR